MTNGNCFVGGRTCPSIAIDSYQPYCINNQGIAHPNTYLIILHPAILLPLELAKYRSHATVVSLAAILA